MEFRKRNGNPLQCSCLENPRDGGAWWAAVYEVAQSRTRLKRLSSSSSNDDPISETAKETQMYRTVFWALWGKARMGWFERIVLKHVYYHMWNRWPVQVRCMRLGAQGWCTGMILSNGMKTEVGEGFRMGNTSTPMADSCQCMAKPLQYCKVISLQLK